MKTLLIEKVANGWIVRPFSPGHCDWARGDESQIWIYRTVEELQAALPELLTNMKGDK